MKVTGVAACGLKKHTHTHTKKEKIDRKGRGIRKGE
jgi:hypothetical protein